MKKFKLAPGEELKNVSKAIDKVERKINSLNNKITKLDFEALYGTKEDQDLAKRREQEIYRCIN